MKHKRRIFIITAIVFGTFLLLGFVLTAGWLFGDTPTEIKNGFSDELLSVLDIRYQITIPDDAVFVKGINTNSMRDPSVVILFELPAGGNTASDFERLRNYIFQKLHLDKSRYCSGGFDEELYTDWYEEMGGKLDYMIDDRSEYFTFLSYALRDDKIIVRFVGWHPGATFS